MRFKALVGALLLSFAVSVFGQDDPLPKPDTQDLPAQNGTVPNASPSVAPALIPADVLSEAERAAALAAPFPIPPTIPQLDEGIKQSALSPTAENARRHAEWRQLQNRVANDADLKAALRIANAAKTDLSKRKLLRDYYELYFTKMIALAPSPETVAYLKDRKKEQLGILPQPRVRPVSPTPTPTS